MSFWCQGYSVWYPVKSIGATIHAFQFPTYISLYPQYRPSEKVGVYNRKTCFLALMSSLLPKWKSTWMCSESNIQCYIVSAVSLQNICNILNLFVHMQRMVRVYWVCDLFLYFPALMSRILNVLLWKCKLLLLWEDNYENKIWTYMNVVIFIIIHFTLLIFFFQGYILNYLYDYSCIIQEQYFVLLSCIF